MFKKKIIKKIIVLGLMIALLALGMLGCGDEAKVTKQVKEEPKPVKKLTVLLDWVPNTNHTGLYVAKDQGFFQKEGLEVEIVQPSQGSAAQLVASGQAQFGISYQEEVTLARLQKVPIVSIAAVIQHNTSSFASKKQMNITRPKDFEGKRYGGFGSPVEEAVLMGIMSRDGGDVKKVQMINMGSADFFASIDKNVDFSWIYQGWTGIEAKLKGIELNQVVLKDFEPALDYYTPVIVTNEQMIAQQPEVVKAFMRAVSQGYQFSMKNPEQAAQSLVKNAPETNAQLAVASQQWLADKYQAEAPRWGEQKLNVWQGYANWMQKNNLLTGQFMAEKAFTNDFLP